MDSDSTIPGAARPQLVSSVTRQNKSVFRQNVICFQTSARLPQAAPLFFPRDRFGPEITYKCVVLDSESRHTRNLGPCCWTHWSVRIVLLDHSSPVTVLLPLQRSAFPLAKMYVLLEKTGKFRGHTAPTLRSRTQEIQRNSGGITAENQAI